MVVPDSGGFYRPKRLSEAVQLKRRLGERALVVAGGTPGRGPGGPACKF